MDQKNAGHNKFARGACRATRMNSGRLWLRAPGRGFLGVSSC